MPEKSEQMSSGNDGDESGGAAVRRGVHRRRVPRSAHPRPPDGPVGVHLAWAWFVPLISAVHTRQQHRPVAIRVPPACSSRHRMNSTCSRRVCSTRYAYARLSTSVLSFFFSSPLSPFPPSMAVPRLQAADSASAPGPALFVRGHVSEHRSRGQRCGRSQAQRFSRAVLCAVYVRCD